MINQILLYIASPMLVAGICLVAPVENWIPNVSRKTADRVAIGSIFCFVIVTTAMAILRLYSLSTKGFDMGIWDHYLYRMSQDGVGFYHLLHRPLFILFMPFHRIGGLPLLFLLQSITVGMSVWIVYRFSLYVFKADSISLVLALAYLLYYPVWYLPLDDFHSDMVFPLLFGILYYQEITEKRSPWVLLSCTGLLFAAKEIMPFILLTFFLALFLRSGKKVYSWLSLFCLIVIIIGFWLKSDIEFYFATIQPIVVKMFYFFCLYVCWGFFSFTNPTFLAPVLIPTCFTLFSNAHSYFNIGYHYQIMYSTPIVFSALNSLATPSVWLRSFIHKYNVKKYAVMLFLINLYFHSLLGPTPLSRQFWMTSLHASNHYTRLWPTRRDKEIIRYLEKEFPPERYSVTVQNGIYYPSLGRQKKYSIFPNNIEFTDIVVLDRALESEYGDTVDDFAYKNTLGILKTKFNLIFNNDGFEIYALRSCDWIKKQ